MAAALLLLPEIMQIISVAGPGVQYLIQWVTTIRTAAQATGEWTAAMETAFLESLLAGAQSKAWTPDAALPKVV